MAETVTMAAGSRSQFADGDSSKEHIERLLRAANDLHRELRIAGIAIHLMGGAKPEVHDRFVLVDDDLYLLGSSLGEFGSRGTMLVRLAFPSLVIPKLERAWERAVGAEEKLAQLAAAASTHSPTPTPTLTPTPPAATPVGERQCLVWRRLVAFTRRLRKGGAR